MKLSVRENVVQADVLIVGGGISGLQAAIAAGEKGAHVVIAEKADTRRSGSGATGNDHFMCYIPEYHGDDYQEILQEICETLVGPNQDVNLLSLMMERSYELIQKWDSYGIDMKPTGKWNFEGHAMPGRRRYHLKYDGHNQKTVLTNKAKEFGAEILNKTAITEILVKDNQVVGAIGICGQYDQPEVVLFQAKTIIIATGVTTRVYPNVNPAYVCNTHCCPANAGGAAIAYRAGARMVNMDLPAVHAGPMQFARCGKATWIGVLTYASGKPVGPFVTKPTRELGDVTSDIWQTVFDEKMKDGSGPVYMNCSQTSEEDLVHMRESFVSEGDTSINDYFDQYGIDLHKHMIEFGTYGYVIGGSGIDVDSNSETTVSGLYASGDLVGNVRGDITSAAVFGQVSGENAAEKCKDLTFADISGISTIQEKIDLYNEILGRENGAHWMEVNSTLNQIMEKYVGVTNVRSETLLVAANKYLHDLKKYALQQLKAENAHELVRALETLDLLDMGIVMALCGENRKESRRSIKRVDYPFTNPLLNNKFQTITLTKDGVKLDFRDKIRKANV
ncbi:MAG: FAD-binding protein [Peptococcaceae bacterium]|nr:FAD-binding protein [Peptococcaceae bacterium]